MKILMFVLGACVGSFACVMLSRRDWYAGRSRCDSCGKKLLWYELIPILSYIARRGRCGECGAKIGKNVILAEIYMGCAFWCAALYIERDMLTGLYVLTVLILLALAAIQDTNEKMVYAGILYAGTAAAVLEKAMFMAADGKNAAVFVAVIAAMELAAVLLSRILHGKIGSGDFDVLITMYALLGGMGAVYAVTYACVLGCIIYLPLIIMKKRKRTDTLPLVPLLNFGTWVFLVSVSAGVEIINRI